MVYTKRYIFFSLSLPRMLLMMMILIMFERHTRGSPLKKYIYIFFLHSLLLVFIFLLASCLFFAFIYSCAFTLFSISFLIAGRCLISVGNARSAEYFLQYSLKLFLHPDTVLLLGKFQCVHNN